MPIKILQAIRGVMAELSWRDIWHAAQPILISVVIMFVIVIAAFIPYSQIQEARFLTSQHDRDILRKHAERTRHDLDELTATVGSAGDSIKTLLQRMDRFDADHERAIRLLTMLTMDLEDRQLDRHVLLQHLRAITIKLKITDEELKSAGFNSGEGF